MPVENHCRPDYLIPSPCLGSFEKTIIPSGSLDSKIALEKELGKLVNQTLIIESPNNKKKTSSEEGTSALYPELLGLSSDDSDADPSYEPDVSEVSTEHSPIQVNKKRSLTQDGARNDRAVKTMYEESDRKVLLDKINVLEKENKRLRRMLVEEIPKMLDSNKKITENFNWTAASSYPAISMESQKETKELAPGSNIFVDWGAWLSAKACSSAGGFVSRLLVNLFTKETLLNSNFKGGVTKNKKEENHTRRDPLDPIKLSALKGATQAAFPAVTDAQFGIFVNQKLTNLRAKQKMLTKQHSATALSSAPTAS